ncbi:hypothetical protein AZF01_20920 [Martelella sp. AD-3]|nr:hypothetical protein AZF01_20920 [Martelella sp. AD-3]
MTQEFITMSRFIASAALVSVLAAAPAAFALQPSAIPETGKVTKAPVGSTVTIESTGKFGNRYQNYFRVGEDGELDFVFQDSAN